jgi:predicted XRE-type DNA-binding protein
MPRWPNRSFRQRFEEKYIPEPNSGCWLWIGSSDKDGYGRIGREVSSDGIMPAHRASYQIYVCEPGESHVLHKCDNPSCVNPDHLWLGDRFDNMTDSAKKLRNGKRKLSLEIVADIKTKRVCQNAFSKLYGISQSHVSRIQNGAVWGWVDG